MDFVNGLNRNQIQLLSLDQMVDRDSWARVVDLFVDALPLDELGFLTIHAGEGRPPFHPADLLNCSSTAIGLGLDLLVSLKKHASIMLKLCGC